MRIEKEGGYRWLLLIHQLPPTPNYLRVKIARRLQRIGAIAIKNTVYALPAAEDALEDLQWTMQEIRAGGGEANIFEAHLIEGLTDGELQQIFNAARDEDYEEIAADARRLASGKNAKADDEDLESGVMRLRKRLAEIEAIDFFGAPKGQAAATLIDKIAKQLPGPATPTASSSIESYRGRTWVTRAGVHVDRMASAWLIRRFIDPDAAFRFVTAKKYRPEAGEVRFDMFDAEFTHEGDQCTFEVLLDRLHMGEQPLRTIAEVVHDIDLKDAKFERSETPGIAAVIASIAMAYASDENRIAHASAVFDSLYVYYQKKAR